MECFRGFMEKMDVGIASIWMKCRCGLNTNRMSRQLYGKRRVLVQLHYKGKWWCDFIANANANIASWQRWMLTRLQCKWWYDFNASTSANVECCRGFMTKMNVGTASMQMNYWHSFMASVRMKCWTLAWPQCKYWCNFNASASAKMECCHDFMTKMNVGTASMLM